MPAIGTPINTSLVDLENQLDFLGLQNASGFINTVRHSTCHAVGDKQGQARIRGSPASTVPPIGHFTFLMRSIMMRHAHDQRYTGTSTTLMSLPPKVRLNLENNRISFFVQ